MSAIRIAWIAGLGALLVMAAVAISASGVLSPASGSSHAATADPHGCHGSEWSQPSGAYAVTFTETGLPSGTCWSVVLHTASGPGAAGQWPGAFRAHGWYSFERNASSTSSIGFQLGNGTYNFSVFAKGNASWKYAASPSYGNFTVDGSSVSVAITFTPIELYPVSFSETGLPSGTFWSVMIRGAADPAPGIHFQCALPFYLHGGAIWNGSTGQYVNFSLPNGTYNFRVWGAWSSNGLYVATPENGTLTVDGASVSESISFAPVSFYQVTFTESGLPSGAFWSVQLSGGGWHGFGWNGSTTDMVNFTVPNGTFGFSISPVWASGQQYVPSPQYGSVTVNGAAVSVSVTFSPGSDPH